MIQLVPVVIKCAGDAPEEVVELVVLGEVIGDYLAVTPELVGQGYDGSWGVTHVPTGTRVSYIRDLCIVCAREYAHRLAGLDIDWSRDTGWRSLPTDKCQIIREISHDMWQDCTYEACVSARRDDD